MNHDESNLESIDPALEARIVAWVLGEASPFEAAELERKLAEDPRLAIFKRRIEAVHGLMGEATAPVRVPLQLAEERRAKLLAVLGGGEPARPEDEAPLIVEKAVRQAPWWKQGGLPMAASAALLVAAFTLFSRNSFRPAPPQSSALPAPAYATSLDQVAQEKKQNEQPSALPPIENGLQRNFISTPAGTKAPAGTIATLGLMGMMPQKSNSASDGVVLGNVTFGVKSAPPGALTVLNGGSNVALSDPALGQKPEASPQDSFGAANTPLAGIFDKSVRVENSLSLGSGTDGSQAESLKPGATQVPIPTRPDQTGDVVQLAQFKGQDASDTLRETMQERSIGQAKSLATAARGLRLQSQGLIASAGSFGGLGGAAAPAAPAPVASGAGEDGIVPVPVFDEKGNKVGYRRSVADLDENALRAKRPPANEESVRSEVMASAQPLSTFSLHVSDVSFRLAFDALSRGQSPDPESIRPEEFYNAFDYGDPSPAPGEPVACHLEQSAHPFLQQRNLVRIAIKVPATGRGADQPLRLTILLDTSGSMQREDRAATAQRAVQVLATLLGPKDQVTLIGFARQPRLLADRLSGAEAKSLVDLVRHTPAEGGTNLEEALKLAGARARLQYLAEAQNRIVVLTDGAANLGSDDPERLASQIAALRQEGISFDACGVGTDGLNDSVLEALTRKGDGRYTVINSPEEADAGFARQLAGAFRPAAENVKLQVRFNPARVGAYRLIGFEQHRLRAEDFRNDRVSAAQLSAEEAAVALYQVQVLPEGEGELGDVSVRFRQTATGQIVERTWTLSFEAQAPAFARASPALQLAGCAAFLAEKLRGGAAAEQIRLSDLAPVVDSFRSSFAGENRVRQLEAMYREASEMATR